MYSLGWGWQFPLQQISLPECKAFTWDDMPEECKFDIPILSPDQYNRLAQEPDIRFTYSVLW